MNTITLSREQIIKQGGMVILPLKEYQELCGRAAPIYYLEGKEAKELDKLVENGLKDYSAGKCVSAGSLKDALQIYGKKNKKN